MKTGVQCELAIMGINEMEPTCEIFKMDDAILNLNDGNGVVGALIQESVGEVFVALSERVHHLVTTKCLPVFGLLCTI